MGIEVLSLDNSKQGHDLNGFSHVLIEFEKGYPDMLLLEKEEFKQNYETLKRENIQHIYACKIVL